MQMLQAGNATRSSLADRFGTREEDGPPLYMIYPPTRRAMQRCHFLLIGPASFFYSLQVEHTWN